jgi:hypothetical protein
MKFKWIIFLVIFGAGLGLPGVVGANEEAIRRSRH